MIPKKVCKEGKREVCAAIVGLRELGDPRRDDGVDEADADTSNDTSTDEHVGVDGGGHEGGTEHAEAGADEAAFTAELATSPTADEANQTCSRSSRQQPSL